MNVPRLDKEIGIEVYATRSESIGGRIRQFPEDFKVEEILANGSKAQIEPAGIPQVSGRGRYLICVLVKRNWDTLLAVQAIAKKLNIDQERVQIAGIKDARALTAQHVSIGRMLPDEAELKLNNLWLYPVGVSNEKIHSNLLFGNQFKINVRAIRHTSPKTLERMKSVNEELLKLGGCPNFFGNQRFGTTRPVTHRVGKCILLGEWEKAALIFLAQPSPYERPESSQAREQLWKTQDYKVALHYFPFKLVYERQMLNHLSKQPRDFSGAFHRLPKKLRQLFIQAYQSYLFNEFLSQRIKQGMPLKKPQKDEFTVTIEGKEHLALPLLGYKQLFSSGEQGEIEKKILEEERVTPKNFKEASVTQRITFSGGLRPAVTSLIESKIEKPVKDDANASKLMVSLGFTLRKGSYATIILREFMKPGNPVEAGF